MDNHRSLPLLPLELVVIIARYFKKNMQFARFLHCNRHLYNMRHYINLPEKNTYKNYLFWYNFGYSAPKLKFGYQEEEKECRLYSNITKLECKVSRTITINMGLLNNLTTLTFNGPYLDCEILPASLKLLITEGSCFKIINIHKLINSVSLNILIKDYTLAQKIPPSLKFLTVSNYFISIKSVEHLDIDNEPSDYPTGLLSLLLRKTKRINTKLPDGLLNLNVIRLPRYIPPSLILLTVRSYITEYDVKYLPTNLKKLNIKVYCFSEWKFPLPTQLTQLKIKYNCDNSCSSDVERLFDAIFKLKYLNKATIELVKYEPDYFRNINWPERFIVSQSDNIINLYLSD